MKSASRTAHISCTLILLAITGGLLGFVLTRISYENMVLVKLDEGTSFSDEAILRMTDDSLFSGVYPYSREKVTLSSTANRGASCILYTVTPDYLKAFPLAMADGRALWAEDIGRRYAVISVGAASKIYGTSSVSGETVLIGKDRYTVVGVYNDNRSFPANLAYQGEDIAYTVQPSKRAIEATHITAVLKNPKNSSLGLKLLERFGEVGDNVESTYSLAEAWFFLKLIARGFVVIYGFILWRIVKRKAVVICASRQRRIQRIFSEHYAASFLRISLGSILTIFGLFLLMLLWALGMVAFFAVGCAIPTEYIPQKLLWEPIRAAFRAYIIAVNTKVPMAHPLVALVHWWRVLLLSVGTAGVGLALYLKKKWVGHS